MLKNARHEAFAQAVARGLPASLAYVEAGYKANDGNACRLTRNERIVARVAGLKALVQNMRNLSTHRVVLTEEWVIEQLIGVVILAKAKQDFAGVNKALQPAFAWCQHLNRPARLPAPSWRQARPSFAR